MLGTLIQFLHPDADLSPDGKVRIVDDGDGKPRIAKWDDALGPPPTPEEIDAALRAPEFEAFKAQAAVKGRPITLEAVVRWQADLHGLRYEDALDAIRQMPSK